jgi:outer membrane protein TolC
MYKNGFAEKLDLDKVQVQLNNLKTTVTTVENAVDLSYAALKFALGLKQSDVVILKEALNSTNIKEGILDNGFQYENRAEIRTLNEVKRLQELDMKRYKMGYLPTVAAAANYTISGMGQKFFTSHETIWMNSSYIGVNVNIPIFDGFQRKYKVEQSRLNVEKVENTIQNVKQAIDLEQIVTKGSLATALTNLDAQERNMQLAERVYNSTKLKFEQGLGSSFEVLQADADMQQSQANYFNALYNAIVARISYQYSLGKLQ